MTLLTPESTRPNRVLPHARSEVSRLTHRRLYRVLTLLLLAGITLVSLIVFVRSSSTASVPAQAQAAYERERQNWEHQFPIIHAQWASCAASVPEGKPAEPACGPEPDIARDGPRLEYFYTDPRYRAADNLRVVVIAVTMASAMLAFLLGASSGGAEWSSRSMTLQLLWEPRRLRLLSLKWLALGLVTAVTTAANLVVGVGLGALTASFRGTWDGLDRVVDSSGRAVGALWPELAGMAGRGIVLVVVVASFGYAIATLVRNTGAALGTAFVYFAVVENAIRLALMRFAPGPYLLSTNAVAFVAPGGIDVPGRLEHVSDGQGGSYDQFVTVHVGNGRAFLALLFYLALLAVPAVLSFTRRDVG